MTDYSTPVKNQVYGLPWKLYSQANTKLFQVFPTIVAGDVTVVVYDDAGATRTELGNIDTLPVPLAGDISFWVALSTDEMNHEAVDVIFRDVSGSEWCDSSITVLPAAGDVYTLLTNATYGLSALKTLIDTITNRIGAFTGTGVNTILGFLRAMSNKGTGATTPSDLTSGGLTFDNTTDSLEKISEVAGSSSDPLDNAVPGTYASGSAGYVLGHLADGDITVVSVVSGGTINVYRDTTWTIPLTGSNAIGNIAGYTKLWFTAKKHKTDADASALVQIEKTAGLLVLNGSSTGLTTADGVITVSDETTGAITITLKYASAAQVALDSGVFWDVKALIGTTMTEKVQGDNFNVLPAITRATS